MFACKPIVNNNLRTMYELIKHTSKRIAIFEIPTDQYVDKEKEQQYRLITNYFC